MLKKLNLSGGSRAYDGTGGGGATMIFTAISWILWFLILYFHRNFRKHCLWEKRDRMTLPVFICCVGITFLIRYLPTALIAPFFEELLFRGLIQGLFAKHVSPRVGIFSSGYHFGSFLFFSRLLQSRYYIFNLKVTY